MRKHGEAPYRIVVLHGGLGGAGRLAPVAQELVRTYTRREKFARERFFNVLNSGNLQCEGQFTPVIDT